MKLWKIIATTVCFVFLNSISILANEWSWDIDNYHYDLVKNVQYNDWNKTDVTVYTYNSASYVLFTAGPITGELAQFEVYIADSNYDLKYLYTSSSSLSHTMSFSEIRELNLSPDAYRLSIVAKGFEDEALDDYTLYVSYVEPDNSTDEVITDKNNNGEVIIDGSNNISTEKTEQNDITTNKIPTTSKDNATTVAKVTPPKRVTIQSAKRLKNNKKKVKITWKKLKGSNIKYEIKCSTSKKFAKKKTKTYTTKKHTFTISKLSKNKKYYIKVRSYKTVNGKKVYGSYSKIKIIKKIK